MALLKSFFTDAYERLLIAATMALIVLIVLCYMWGVAVLLRTIRAATAAPSAPGSEQGFRVEEAEQLLRARGILP